LILPIHQVHQERELLHNRSESHPMLATHIQLRYVSLDRFAKLTGYATPSIYHQIEEGKWLQDEQFIVDENGQILIDLQAYYEWVDGNEDGKYF
jgi:hypothetical protein